MKHKALKEQTNQIVENLRQGGKQAVQGRIIFYVFVFDYFNFYRTCSRS